LLETVHKFELVQNGDCVLREHAGAKRWEIKSLLSVLRGIEEHVCVTGLRQVKPWMVKKSHNLVGPASVWVCLETGECRDTRKEFRNQIVSQTHGNPKKSQNAC
jgi:hypothetical protein